jgi:diaminopimelate decarboxylase
MAEQYNTPTIISHRSGLANKFGQSQKSPSMPLIDGVNINNLMKEHGSPLFIFSERKLRRTIQEARLAFELRYPRVKFAWSYKTNYLDAICKIFHDEGSWAEVVSEHEYEMARRLKIPGDQIIYNGPYKSKESLRTAMDEGAMIHIDNHDELYLAEQIATELGRKVNIGMRLNMDTGQYPAWSRFGFNLDNGEALAALKRIRLGEKLNFTGIHCHLGTFLLDPEVYSRAIEKLAGFARKAAELDFDIDYIDIGGGFASSNTLHEQYSPGEESNPGFDDYAKTISEALLNAEFPGNIPPTLVLETGRALVDEAGFLATTVVAHKRLPTGEKSIVIDAGVNCLFTSFWYKHKVTPVDEFRNKLEETVLYGPLCMNIDVIRPSVLLPPMNTGDALVIHPVGAYNVTQWMQFIRMRPAVVLIGENGQVHVIRKAETIDALKDFESIPDWLK